MDSSTDHSTRHSSPGFAVTQCTCVRELKCGKTQQQELVHWVGFKAGRLSHTCHTYMHTPVTSVSAPKQYAKCTPLLSKAGVTLTRHPHATGPLIKQLYESAPQVSETTARLEAWCCKCRCRCSTYGLGKARGAWKPEKQTSEAWLQMRVPSRRALTAAARGGIKLRPPPPPRLITSHNTGYASTGEDNASTQCGQQGGPARAAIRTRT